MDITVYLPDELGRRAKDANVNLSAALRGEVEAELRRRETTAKTAAQATEHRLTVEGDTGTYQVRLHGKRIAEDRNVAVFVGEDAQLYVYDWGRAKLVRNVEVEDLRDWLGDDEAYVEAMAALGEEAIIDVGLPQ